MRILNIIQCTNLGGMEKASLRLMQGLSRRGHDLDVISLHPLGALAPQLASAGIPAVGFSYLGPGGCLSWWSLRRAIRARRPDAVIMTGHNLLAIMALSSRARQRRILSIHFHHTGVKPRWFWKLFYWLAERRFDAIVFPSDFVRLEAIALSSRIAGKAHTVRYPTDSPVPITGSERRIARSEWRLPIDAPIIGNAGWLIPRKRFDVFLRVAAVVREQAPRAVFLIAGDGPEAGRLRELAASLGLSDSIVWLGWQQDMRRFYACLDVLLFHSDWDCLPVTPQEALVHGIPLVASILQGGLAEIIRPGRDAVLLNQHAIDQLAAGVLQAIESPALAGQGARIARRHLLDLGDPETIALWHEQALAPQPGCRFLCR